ncbi:tyrosine kinase domain protein [Rhizoctonia solani 123E]|uniref:Tyrosine kinase domain protein n=1 Tax=Rhizoctonia solani 123E TaxID=1423351 RepID=A0A074RKX3_9AGAM|nr:tyrosine kinase domain protein [Rhizoctonia solani 123E]
MGDPEARFDAIRSQGAVAHDMAECFREADIAKARLETSDVVSQITFPCEFDIKDVLVICRAIHEGSKTRNYTLQVFNCYFFALAIQVCLTRFVAHWEDEALVLNWLTQVNTGVGSLADTFCQSTTVPLEQQSPLLRIFQTLFLREGNDLNWGVSLVEGTKLKLQSRLQITKCSENACHRILHIINNLLWYSSIDTGLDRFVEDNIRESLKEIIAEKIAIISNATSRPNELLIFRQLKVQLSFLLVQLLVSAGTKTGNFYQQVMASSTSLKQKPVFQVVPSVLKKIHSIIQASLAPPAWIKIDQRLDDIASELETLEHIGRVDLERWIDDVKQLVSKKTVVWEQNPWDSIHRCIRGRLSIDLIKNLTKGKPKIVLYQKGEPETIHVSVFQHHILNRIQTQAKMVAKARLGSEAKTQQELEDMLAQVWKTIREDPSIKKNAIQARHTMTLNQELNEISSAEVVALLNQHGCNDVTDSLDLSACSQHPFASGGFGDVFFGRLWDRTAVAIKTIPAYYKPGEKTLVYNKQAAKEVYTWSKCKHPNVVQLTGLAVFRDCVAMVSRWEENGNLLSYLSSHPSTDRCNLSLAICDGLAYLHGIDIVSVSLIQWSA